jgi:hypothetical protein
MITMLQSHSVPMHRCVPRSSTLVGDGGAIFFAGDRVPDQRWLAIFETWSGV